MLREYNPACGVSQAAEEPVDIEFAEVFKEYSQRKPLPHPVLKFPVSGY